MDSIVSMEHQIGWVASQKIVHVQSMEWGWNPSIPYGLHTENSGECKDLSQTALIDKIVSQFGHKNTLPLPILMDPGLKLWCTDYKKLTCDELEQITKLPYKSLVRCLLYLSIGMCPNITYSVQQLSQYLNCYMYTNWNAALRVVCYLSGMHDYRLCLGGNSPISITWVHWFRSG